MSSGDDGKAKADRRHKIKETLQQKKGNNQILTEKSGSSNPEAAKDHKNDEKKARQIKERIDQTRGKYMAWEL